MVPLTIDHTASSASRPRALWAELYRREPLYASATLVLLLAIAPTTIAAMVDPRTLDGVGVWWKPLKFEISLALFLGTLAWFAAWLPETTASRGWYRPFTIIVLIGVALEMLWIGGAAAAGIRSHYNTDIAAMRAIYGLMGIVAIVLTSTALVFGVLVLANRTSPLNPALRWGVGLGLCLTFVLTVTMAGAMAARPGPLIGNGTPLLRSPLMGWSRDGGDLRVPHFFATHAMHVLPVAGFIASRLVPAAVATGATIAASLAYVAFVGWTFIEALAGRPFPLAI